MPIPDFVKAIMPMIEANSGSLMQSVARCVTKRTGMAVDPLVWAAHQLDARLTLRIEVTDSDGLVMDSDRDLLSLQRRLGDQVGDIQHASSATVYHDWPEGIKFTKGGIELRSNQAIEFISLLNCWTSKLICSNFQIEIKSTIFAQKIIFVVIVEAHHAYFFIF